MSEGRRIAILLVDDHPIVREGLSAILATQADMEVVGEAAGGEEALALAARLEPDIVLLDLEMPDLDGVETLRAMMTSRPGTRVIVFTAFDTDEQVMAAVKAGASGYLLKGAPRQELFRAIRVVDEGGSLLEPVVASRLLRQMSRDSVQSTEALTPREVEVLGLLAQGLQNKEIAAELAISERTVKFHVSAILAKLGAGNRTEAVAIAAQRGLIHLDRKE